MGLIEGGDKSNTRPLFNYPAITMVIVIVVA